MAVPTAKVSCGEAVRLTAELDPKAKNQTMNACKLFKMCAIGWAYLLGPSMVSNHLLLNGLPGASSRDCGLRVRSGNSSGANDFAAHFDTIISK